MEPKKVEWRCVVVETPDKYGYYINDNLKCTWSKDFYNPTGMVPSKLENEAWENAWERKARGHGYERMTADRLPDSLVPVEVKPAKLKKVADGV